MNKFNKWSTLLSCVGAVGTVATAVLAVKATPKAMSIIEEEYTNEVYDYEPMTNARKIKLTWKCYIPAIIAGTTTIACIFGANRLNKHALAALASSYMMLNDSYKEYKNKVTEIYGEKSEACIKEEIAKDHYNKEEVNITDDDTLLFFDYNSLQYFNAKMSDVIQKADIGDGMECYIITSPFDWKMNYI